MGRGSGKVTLKQIQDAKVRKAAFMQRKKGLTKKVSEFSNSFGVEACLIVFDGDGDGKPITWPQDYKTLQSMLTKYEQQKFETTPKDFKVKDYFANKKNMAELEILRVRKKIAMKKHPTWGRCFYNLDREELQGFIDMVDIKIEACNRRINVLKNTGHIPEEVASPQSSQPKKPIINISEMADFTDLIEWTDPMPQENAFSSHSSQPMKPIIDISEMEDFTDLIEWNDLMPQENAFSSHSSQLDVMDIIPQMQPDPAPLQPHDNISLSPVSSTDQLGEFGKMYDLMDQSDQEWVATQFDFDDSAANKLNDGDGDGWMKQPDMFQWNDISFLSEIEQECAALDAFPQPRYGF
ncbi:unnamed protein product [Trifolium pratense]|uniref:Uncharacterized protein n=1 Tax=Trifolium pratense TaxID=57577 RepID=A0ACB0IWU9_TRIPR|nr:unnamed protein product [Trifolium pratense]